MGKVEDFDDDNLPVVNPEMIFTDRDNPRRVFWNAYDALGKGEFYVINYHGFGGIGKSRLCAYLNECLQSGIHPETQQKISSKSLILNFEELKNNCEKVNVLENLANKFENECGYRFPLFKYALYVYYITDGCSKDSPEIKKLQDNAIAGTVMEAFQLVPVIGSVGSVVLKGIDTLAASMKEKVLKNSETIKRLDHMSTEDISEELIKLFVKELREQTQAESAPVVVFLDTYEQLQNYVYQKTSAKVSEEWLWTRTGVIRRVPNVLWVLAGQRQVDWGKSDSFWRDEANIIYEQISEIKEDERVKDMLMKIGIKEEEIVDLIVDKTNGVPVHLALCKDTYFNLKAAGIQPTLSDFDMDYTQLARRFIGGLKSQLKDIVDILACLETWTQDDIVEMDFSADSYEYIMQLSFIKKDKDHYSMHKSVQEIVYMDCSPLIRAKVLSYFTKKIQDPMVKAAEKKDYILKKLGLQAHILKDMEASAQKEEKGKELLDETMQYIQEYLWDYNFFEKAKNMLWNNGLEAYMDEVSKKKLDIYIVYHSVLNGEFATVRHYMESGAIYKKAGLDPKTTGLLYFALGSLENTKENYAMAKQYLAEAYTMLSAIGEKEILLDVIERISLVCYNMARYKDMEYYCRQGLEMLSQERMDTRRILLETGFYVDRAKAARMQDHYNEALQWLAKIEETLSIYESKETVENDSLIRRHLIVFGEYFYIYGTRSREDLQKKYAALMLEYAQKAYELCPSDRNYRNLGVSYRDAAKKEENLELREQYFDKYIHIIKALYEEAPTSVRYDEIFSGNRVAMSYFRGEKAQKYIAVCEDMLRNPKEYAVSWKEAYLYHRSLLSYYRKEKDWNSAEEKLSELEKLLENRKEKLSTEKYEEYLCWNYWQRGLLYEQQGQLRDAIRMWEKELGLEKKKYFKDVQNQDGKDYAIVCKRLADMYMKCGLTDKAIYYSRERLDVYKEMLKDYPESYVFSVYGAMQTLCRCYKKYRRHEEMVALCKEVSPYFWDAYAKTKDGEWLDCLSSTVDYMCDALMWQGQKEEALEHYQMFLAECAKGGYTIESKSTIESLQNMIDYLKCRVACILYVQRQGLDIARKYLMNATCPYREFKKADRELFLGKVEKCIQAENLKPIYLTKEQGLAYIQEEPVEE